MELASYPEWAQEMMASSLPSKEKVVRHELFGMMKEARLPAPAAYQFFVGGWPVIEQFPQYMAVNLCKARYGRSAGEDMARKYLMKNIRIEQNHADHWVEWAQASGLHALAPGDFFIRLILWLIQARASASVSASRVATWRCTASAVV